MRKFFISAFLVGAFLSGTNALAQASNLTAAEIASHRVGKLILLKKIDSAFQTRFKGLEVENLANGGTGKASFKITISQQVDAGASANKVVITSDSTGKALGHVVVAGTNSSNSTVFLDKDPITLTELSLHHVEHLGGSDQKIAQFIKPLKALRISQVLEDGQPVVIVEFVANGIKERLTMKLKSDGTLINTEVK